MRLALEIYFGIGLFLAGINSVCCGPLHIIPMVVLWPLGLAVAFYHDSKETKK